MSSRVELVSALPRLQRKRPIPGSLHGRPKVRLREEEGSPEAQQGHTLSFESSLQLLLTPGRGRTNTVVLIFVCAVSNARISSARLETGRTARSTDVVVINFAASAPLIVVATLY